MNYQKVALITGCNGGVGRTLERAFTAAGYLVVGTDIHPQSRGGSTYYLPLDLAALVDDPAQLSAFHTNLTSWLRERGGTLHALINNAALQIVASLDQLTLSDFVRTQQVNLVAPFALAKVCAQELRSARGSVVNIGSIHARLTKPGFCAYSSSKAALGGLTRALALEFGGEVTVNCISPAATRTEMLVDGFLGHPHKLDELAAYHPVGRIGDPDEIAKLAVFLCSETARFITGADLAIDGGIGARLHDPA